MNKETLLIVSSIVASPFIGVFITSIFNRYKTGAEVKVLNVTGEIGIVGLYEKYALQMQKDKEELRKEFSMKIEELKEDHKTEIMALKQEFSRITTEKDERITTLESQVAALQLEVAKYKNENSYTA